MAEGGRRFSLDDIIAEEVKKAVSKNAVPSGPSGGWGLDSLGIKSLGDITSLLKEINALAQTFSGNRDSGVSKPVRYMDGSGLKISKDDGSPPGTESLPPPQIDISRLVDNFINYMPLFIQTYGDIRLSEVEPLLKEHRDDIIVALQAVL